ncbi:MAG: hypothetical protein M3072_10080 [Candidatus Dormibacteraeota bacterium]|nr:hypothetical protein [Candidatus Dormibacteraeota bacterium]
MERFFVSRRLGQELPWAVEDVVDELEQLGYVQRQSDLSDRRAKLVVLTPAARGVTGLVRRVNDDIESRNRARLGEQAYLTLRKALTTMVPRSRGLIQPRLTAVDGVGVATVRAGTKPSSKRESV